MIQLLILICSYLCLSPNGTIKIRIGVNLGVDPVNDLSMVDLPQGVYIRAHHFNQITDLIHPDASVELVYLNHFVSKSRTIQNSIELANRGVIAAIGSTYSSLTELGSLITQTYNIPLCDGGATSPTLSNKGIYPNFFRTIPNDAAQAEAILGFVLSQGWSKVAIVYTTESYGQGLATFFTNTARANNVTILSSQPIYPGATAQKFSDTAANFKDSGARIFIYFGYPEEYVGLVREAKKNGIYGVGYNWIGGDAMAFILSGNQDRSVIAGTSYFFPVEGKMD
jgi:ABC-type branched-subunit amino acid transport system substrate-binding protein